MRTKTTQHQPNKTTLPLTWKELELFHSVRCRLEHAEAHGLALSAEDCAFDAEERARIVALGQKLDTLKREETP